MPDMSRLDDRTLTQRFLAREARELANQMDWWNEPDQHKPTDAELSHWAGRATAILKLVDEELSDDA